MTSINTNQIPHPANLWRIADYNKSTGIAIFENKLGERNKTRMTAEHYALITNLRNKPGRVMDFDACRLEPRTCRFCLLVASKKCSGCLRTYYCDSTCQLADLKSHQPFCKEIQSHRVGVRNVRDVSDQGGP